jgi:NAD(P)-dependent dehydrogenase (short-subunit alcohol dehydrogenase family)
MHDDGDLRRHVVVVTGASSGLGEQLARTLVAHGARPVLAARRAERLDALRDELDGAVDTVACDVTDDGDRRRLIETVLELHGRIDGLVNNAGMGATGPALQLGAEDFARVLNLNLTAPIALSCLVGELDAAIKLLLGRSSSFVTGQVLGVDGGLAVR